MANYIVIYALSQKIMRFRAEKLRKTLRVYVYDQNSLGWPYRFTKKINKMVTLSLFRHLTTTETLIKS